MVELRRACHCVYKIRYHMVLVVKYRKKLLFVRDRFEFLKEVCVGIGERYWFEFDSIGTDGDHVHILVGAAPRYAPARVMQIIKSIIARQLFKRYPEIKQQLWGGEFWHNGGYIGTVGEGITEDLIRKYIEEHGTPEEKEGYKQMKILNF
ncbi:MAG: IS200/IS605 family transposase [Calditrichia bacterium]